MVEYGLGFVNINHSTIVGSNQTAVYSYTGGISCTK